MKQTVSVIQRIISVAVGLALLVVLAGLFLVGIVFLWYVFLFAVLLFIARRIYFFFKGKPDFPVPPPERPGPVSDNVVAGDFRRSSGRIIDHDKE